MFYCVKKDIVSHPRKLVFYKELYILGFCYLGLFLYCCENDFFCVDLTNINTNTNPTNIVLGCFLSHWNALPLHNVVAKENPGIISGMQDIVISF
jgi:hypothetical protein